LIAPAVEAFGDLHVLVNNAGILRDRVLVNMTEEEWDAVIHVTSRAHSCLARHAAASGASSPRRARRSGVDHQHVLDVGLSATPGQDELRRGEGRHCRVQLIAGDGVVAVRRSLELHRPGGTHAPHEARRAWATSSPRRRRGQVRCVGPGQRVAAGGVPATENCPLTGKTFFVQGVECRSSQGWTMTEQMRRTTAGRLPISRRDEAVRRLTPAVCTRGSPAPCP